MSTLAIIAIAVGLAMDAFSVCILCGLTINDLNYRHYFRLAFHFGLFQFMMPVLGFYAGLSIEVYIRDYDHWIAMVLLSAVGIKMIKDSFIIECPDEPKDPSRGLRLVMLAVATSIDALAVGLSLAILGTPIIIPSIIIGVVCAVFSIAGIYLGKRAGALLGHHAERVGGLILVAIGVKIVLDHLLQ